MRVPPEFRIVLTGKTINAITRENVNPGLAWYLTQLLKGVELPDDVFDPWGITVEIEPDMDQGD